MIQLSRLHLSAKTPRLSNCNTNNVWATLNFDELRNIFARGRVAVFGRLLYQLLFSFGQDKS